MGIENEIKLLENLKFNLGACILAPVWLYWHEKKTLAAISAVLVIMGNLVSMPFSISILMSLVVIAIAIYAGIKGNEIAKDSGRYSSEEELKYAQKNWLRWGVYTAAVLFILNSVFHMLGSGLSLFKIGADAISL